MTEQIKILEIRQLELQAIMASSDSRASKCTKNGISFREVYPTEYADYIAANQEYNANEAEITRLAAILETEITENHEEVDEPTKENN